MNAIDKARDEAQTARAQLDDLKARQQMAISEAIQVISARLPEIPLTNGQSLHDEIEQAVSEATYEVEKTLEDEAGSASRHSNLVSEIIEVVSFQHKQL